MKAQDKSGLTVDQLIEETALKFEKIRQCFEECGKLSVGVFNLKDMQTYKLKQNEAINIFNAMVKELISYTPRDK